MTTRADFVLRPILDELDMLSESIRRFNKFLSYHIERIDELRSNTCHRDSS